MAAGLDVAASIVGIAYAGIQLTNELYKFGASFAGAKEQIDDIVFEVTTYSGTLKELAQRLEDEDAVHSDNGLLLATSLREGTERIFGQILSSLPQQGSAEKMSMLQRAKWHFKKGRVEWLVAKLQSLKLSLLVLIQALYAGRVIFQAREKNDTSATSEERIGLEKTHLGTLLIQRYRKMQQMPDLEDAAEKEEKAMVDASPSGPPEGFVPVATRSLALIKYEGDPLAAIDAAQSEADDQGAQAIVLHDPKQWPNYIIGEVTIALSDSASSDDSYYERTAQGMYDVKGDDGSVASTQNTHRKHSRDADSRPTDRTKTLLDGGQVAVRELSVEEFDLERPRGSTGGLRRTRTYDSRREDEIEKQGVGGTRRDRTNSFDGLSRASTSVERWPDDNSSRSLRREDDENQQVAPQMNSQKRKYGIVWRRGRGPVKSSTSIGPNANNPARWRQFVDEKLVDFDVSNATLNVTENDFRSSDRWSEITVSSGKISSAALNHMGYPFHKYERYVRTEQPKDSEGNATGPAYDVFEDVFHIELPLLFSEMLELARVTYRINRDRPKRLNWWHLPSENPPKPRHELDLRNDLPFPHAPLGRNGFRAGRMLNKGTRWLNLGNYVISSLANGDAGTKPGEFLPSVMQALSRGGKDIPDVSSRDGAAKLDWSVGESGKKYNARFEEVRDEDDGGRRRLR